MTAVLAVAGHIHMRGIPAIVEVRYAPGLYSMRQTPLQLRTSYRQHHTATLAASLGFLIGRAH